MPHASLKVLFLRSMLLVPGKSPRNIDQGDQNIRWPRCTRAASKVRYSPAGASEKAVGVPLVLPDIGAEPEGSDRDRAA